MSKIKSQAIVQRIIQDGRAFDIQRTTWVGMDGLSFDVIDVETNQCLTAESLDEWPSAEEIEDLRDRLGDDLEWGVLDPFFYGSEDDLRKIVCKHPDVN